MDLYLKQTLSIPQYKGKTWRGAAMHIGAGITNIEMYAAADKVGYRADGPIAGGGFSFVNTGDNYWKAISACLEHLLTLNEPHGFGTFWAFTALGFQLQTVQKDLPALMAAFEDIAVNSAGVGGSAISGMSTDDVARARGRRGALFAMRGGQAQLNARQDGLRGVTPGGGAYLGKATCDSPDWKTDYFSANYGGLLRLKDKWDPSHLFWANTAVGSDVYWTPATDERLCRAGRNRTLLVSMSVYIIYQLSVTLLLMEVYSSWHIVGFVLIIGHYDVIIWSCSSDNRI
ncbi:putative FAD FMN-containing isoamyl alcohol oxidase [Rosellinia necatrix]|uniref:Putative FAD FMN-containing isoamyl alcohol oxidase n=1 Tax=Rosellinia necatrix TaxID=77044 RepID=A0A1W2TQ84_ROSNE|nr:putative FAD FMN-containing isoamyl alcohol oxidase [Rosellinia necatrix]